MLSASRLVGILTRYVACFRCPRSIEPTTDTYIVVLSLLSGRVRGLSCLDSLNIPSRKTTNGRADGYVDLLDLGDPYLYFDKDRFQTFQPPIKCKYGVLEEKA